MEKHEYRSVIKFFVLEGLSATEIRTKMVNVLKQSAPSFPTVHRWTLEFKRGRTSVEDDPRSGRPKTATSSKNIEKVHDMVLDDRRVKVREIADAIGISTERVFHILHAELKMKKLCTKWVPHLLTIDNKRMRMRICQASLECFNKNKTDFVDRFITMDETWIHYYMPEINVAGSSAPKKAKTVLSEGKIMASVFWDAKGILLIDYLKKGKRVNSEYYTSLLDQLDEKIREKRPGLQKIIYHQDNAPAHKSVLTMAKISELKYELLEHPPYSPDLAPSDYHLFPNLKNFLSGKHFSSNEEAIDAVDSYFASLDTNSYKHAIEMLEKRWTKCIELQGDYIEKLNNF